MHHQLNIHLPNFGLNRELTEIYFAIILRAMAYSTIGIFVPLFLFKEMNLGLSKVAYYYLALTIVFALTMFLAMKFSCKFGFKHSIFVSVPLDIIALGLLYGLEKFNIYFLIPALVVGFSGAFFWSGFHVHFAKSSDKARRGSEVGVMYALIAVFAILGPFVGGVILTNYGFNTLFVVVSGLLVASMIPLLFSEDGHDEIVFKVGDLKKVYNFRDMLVFIGLGIRYMIVLVFWPIFVFTILGAYVSMGIIASISGLIGIVVTFFAGKLSDRYDKGALSRIGAFVHAVVFFFRGTVGNFTQVLIVDNLSALSGNLGDVSTDALFYDKANEISRPAYVVFRELFLSTGKMIVLIAILVTGSIASTFVLGGLGSLLWMLY